MDGNVLFACYDRRAPTSAMLAMLGPQIYVPLSSLRAVEMKVSLAKGQDDREGHIVARLVA
jgi:hypothetical protein